MEDSNSEPPRCPCGFFGSSQTGGLCSKCFKDQQKKLGESSGGSGSSAVDPKSVLTAGDLSRAFEKAKASTSTPSPTEGGTPEPSSSGSSSTEKATDEAAAAAVPSSVNDKNEESNQSTDSSSKEPMSVEEEAQAPSNGNKRDISDVQDPERPLQKNRKRCFKCNCKLELAIREIGRCKCDYVFCQMHRLPEQHDCIFDHKEHGRKEARDKMVSPKKHVGTSLRRLDSDTY